MKRTDLNGLIDALAAVEALLLLSTGLLIWLRLPAGSGHGLTVWLLDRHQWGDIHAWIAMAMVATLLVHLVLHWKWIVCVVSGQDAATKRRRQLTGLVLLGAVLFTAASPFIAPIDARQATVRGHGPAVDSASSVDHGADHLSLNGRMTVGEAAAILGKSLADLEAQIGLPGGVSEEERLGPLARELGISMAELRERLTQ
jgi:hypothetical protein